jgi:hypothetical protein
MVAAGSLLDEALALAGQVSGHPLLGVQLSERSLHANLEAPSFVSALELESRGQVALMHDPATAEAVAAVRDRPLAARRQRS